MKFSLSQTLGAALALVVSTPTMAQTKVPSGTPETSTHDAAIQADHKACFDRAQAAAPKQAFAEGKGVMYGNENGKVQCVVALQYDDTKHTHLVTVQFEASDKQVNHTIVTLGRNAAAVTYVRAIESYENSKYVDRMQGTAEDADVWSLDRDRKTGFYGRIQRWFDVANKIIAPARPLAPIQDSAPINQPQ